MQVATYNPYIAENLMHYNTGLKNVKAKNLPRGTSLTPGYISRCFWVCTWTHQTEKYKIPIMNTALYTTEISALLLI